jgi:ankyrin repeat protein
LLLDAAFKDNHVKKVECVLFVRSLTTWRFIASDEHLSHLLVKAITNGQTEIVRLLLEHGANPNGTPENPSPLIEGITNGQTEIVRLLLEHGANPNGTPENPSPLIEAIRHSRTSIVSILLEYDCFLGNTAFGMPLCQLGKLHDLRALPQKCVVLRHFAKKLAP